MQIKKSIIFIFLLVFLNNCGFTASYKGGTNLNLKVELKEVSGDRTIYNLISSNLKRYSYDEAIKTAEVSINSKYERIILAKDVTGKTTDYQIKVTAIFNVEIENLKKEFTFVETFDYKSLAKNFEELQYEETIKQNISNIISRKLMNQLSRL